MARRFHIILLLLISLCTLAQPKLMHEEMYVGAQGGALASMVMFSPRVSQEPLHCYLGPTAGVVFRYIGHKVCGLQVEVNYMQRGWQEYKDEESGYRRQMDYIEVPLLTHLYFGKKVRGFVNLGPQLGYLVHESQSRTDMIPDLLSHAWQDGEGSRVGHQYVPTEKRFDWGLAGGLGMYYRSRYAGTYQIEARFNYSLGSIFSTSKMDYFANSNHMNLSLTFAYMWQVKGDKGNAKKKHN